MIRHLVIISCILLTSACGNVVDRRSSDFAQQLSRNDIVLLPNLTEAYTVGSSGSERAYDYEGFMQDEINRQLPIALAEKGYSVRTLQRSELKKDKLYQDIHTVQRAFSEIRRAERKKNSTRHVKKEEGHSFSGNMLEATKSLENKIDEELIFINLFNETVRDSGSQTVQFATNIAMALIGVGGSSTPAEIREMHFGIVNRETGNIVWMMSGHDFSSVEGAALANAANTKEELMESRIADIIEKTLEKLPHKDKLFDTEE